MWQTQCHLWRPLYFTMGWMVFSPSPVGSFMTEIALKQPPECMKLISSWGMRPNVRPNVQLFGSVPFRRVQAIYHPFFPQWLVTNRLPVDDANPPKNMSQSHLWYGHPSHRWNPSTLAQQNYENGMVDHLQEMNSSSSNCSYLFIMFFYLRKALVVQVFPQDLPR